MKDHGGAWGRMDLSLVLIHSSRLQKKCLVHIAEMKAHATATGGKSGRGVSKGAEDAPTPDTVANIDEAAKLAKPLERVAFRRFFLMPSTASTAWRSFSHHFEFEEIFQKPFFRAWSCTSARS